MEVGSPGHGAAERKSEVEKVLNPETKDLKAPTLKENVDVVAVSVEGTADVSNKHEPVAPASDVTDAPVAFSFPYPPVNSDDTGGVEAAFPPITKLTSNDVPAKVTSLQAQVTEVQAQVTEDPARVTEVPVQVTEVQAQVTEAQTQENLEQEYQQAVEHEYPFDDMVVLKDGMVTSASPADRAHGDNGESLLMQEAPRQPFSFPFPPVDNASVALKEVPSHATASDVVVAVTKVTTSTEAGAVELTGEVAALSTNGSQEPVQQIEAEAVSNAAEAPSIGKLVEEHPPVDVQAGLPPVTPQVTPTDITGAAAGESEKMPVTEELPKEPEKAGYGQPQEGEQAETEKQVDASHEVIEQDIQAIKGQKVLKRFGKKNYSGTVIDFDTESKWFKVIYEDGDEEDLELSEVKAILVSTDQPSSSKKRVRSEGGADAESKKSTKKPKKTTAGSTAKKAKTSKSVIKSPKTLGSKSKSSKKTSTTTKKSKSPGKSVTKSPKTPKTPKTPQTKKGAKGKAKSGTKSPKSMKGGSSSSKSGKAARVSRVLDLQSPKAQTSGKSKLPVQSSTKKKVAKSPGKAVKVDSELKMTPKKSGGKRKADKDMVTEPKSKRSKKDGVDSEEKEAEKSEQLSYVGRSVRKDFDGTLYDGSVVKFDKKTNYFKVKYEDGDQEDLEWAELEEILVPEGSDIDTDTKPTKLSSLSTLMSQENVGTGKKKK